MVHDVPLRSKKGGYNIIIETPKGCRNKYAYNPDLELFLLKKVLPAGHVFPFDFGFCPDTRGQDGDPLDVLLLMDEPGFPGCMVEARIIGMIRATQKAPGKEAVLNDRLIAVSVHSTNQETIMHINDLDKNLIKEIEHFFISYNEMEGRVFTITGREGPEAAEKLIQESGK